MVLLLAGVLTWMALTEANLVVRANGRVRPLTSPEDLGVDFSEEISCEVAVLRRAVEVVRREHDVRGHEVGIKRQAEIVTGKEKTGLAQTRVTESWAEWRKTGFGENACFPQTGGFCKQEVPVSWRKQAWCAIVASRTIPRILTPRLSSPPPRPIQPRR